MSIDIRAKMASLVRLHPGLRRRLRRLANAPHPSVGVKVLTGHDWFPPMMVGRKGFYTHPSFGRVNILNGPGTYRQHVYEGWRYHRSTLRAQVGALWLNAALNWRDLLGVGPDMPWWAAYDLAWDRGEHELAAALKLWMTDTGGI